jgi:hypothetical protein
MADMAPVPVDDLAPQPRPMPRLLVVVVPSFVLAGVAVAADLPVAVRGPLVLWAVLGVPALVLASRLGTRTSVERWVLGGAGAAGVTILLSQALLYADLWSPTLLLVVMGVLCVAVAGLRRIPSV